MTDLIVHSHQGANFEDGQDRGRVIVFSADTGGKYSLMEWTVSAAASSSTDYGAHLHKAFEETFLVKQGELDFLLGNTITTLKKGDFVRVPPGVRHGYKNSSGEEVQLLVSFVPGGFESLFLKYRTDQIEEPVGEGFAVDASRLFGSEFE